MFLCQRFIRFFFAMGLWQMISPTNGQLSEAPEIFEKSHKAVVTVLKDNEVSGTGFSVDLQSDIVRDRKVRYVITAFHVVNGAKEISVYLYTDDKNREGIPVKRRCDATLFHVDVTRGVAILALPCDNCNCTALGSLETRLSPVRIGETIFVIGDSKTRNPHSFAFGMLSDIDFDLPLIQVNYEEWSLYEQVLEAKVHGLIGNVNIDGDSGSPVMDKTGKVIAMVSGTKHVEQKEVPFINVMQVYCVTVGEIFTVYKKIFENTRVNFVGCTADESGFRSIRHLRLTDVDSGKSYLVMNALATAMNVQYFAVAHGKSIALAIFFESYDPQDRDRKVPPECLCESDSFIDSNLFNFEPTKCGCFYTTCRDKAPVKSKEVNYSILWAVYKRKNTHADYIIKSDLKGLKQAVELRLKEHLDIGEEEYDIDHLKKLEQKVENLWKELNIGQEDHHISEDDQNEEMDENIEDNPDSRTRHEDL